ncbi:glycoside hydrolase family 25 protein [Paraferrimonas sp. SM1919]|uniref:glycoside hydrolase family 25 protein n=1 Tax=Paraferrimonas sp. SM1919 TaxID=2662263 RepID=UPI0013D13986|nr:GH25 family lysozyme [Paraferrimonas sp. SM1919]
MKIFKYFLWLLGLTILIWRPHFSSSSITTDSTARPMATSFSHKGLSYGVDVSHYQGKIDFSKLQTEVDFIYVKATEGDTFIDPMYKANVEGLQTIQLANGAYHFFKPDIDAIQQAKLFVSLVRHSKHTLPAMLDVEVISTVSTSKLQQGVKAWLDYVAKELGCQPIIYSDLSFWQDNLASTFPKQPLWVADYQSINNGPPNAGTNQLLWQYTDKGRLTAISGYVDLSVAQHSTGACYAS